MGPQTGRDLSPVQRVTALQRHRTSWQTASSRSTGGHLCRCGPRPGGAARLRCGLGDARRPSPRARHPARGRRACPLRAPVARPHRRDAPDGVRRARRSDTNGSWGLYVPGWCGCWRRRGSPRLAISETCPSCGGGSHSARASGGEARSGVSTRVLFLRATGGRVVRTRPAWWVDEHAVPVGSAAVMARRGRRRHIRGRRAGRVGTALAGILRPGRVQGPPLQGPPLVDRLDGRPDTVRIGQAGLVLPGDVVLVDPPDPLGGVAPRPRPDGGGLGGVTGTSASTRAALFDRASPHAFRTPLERELVA